MLGQRAVDEVDVVVRYGADGDEVVHRVGSALRSQSDVMGVQPSGAEMGEATHRRLAGVGIAA